MTIVSQAVPYRGRLEIAERAVEKVARQVANEVTGTGGRSGGVLGLGAKGDLSARPEVDVHLDGSSRTGTTATLRVTVGLPYPTPLRSTTEEVRNHMMRRVPALTGIDVHRVDVEVAWLLPGAVASGNALQQTAHQSTPHRRRVE